MKIDTNNPFEIAENIFCIMIYTPKFNFYCNTYVIIEEDEVVLIEPGSIIHFPETARKIMSVCDIKKTNYIILSHQDPDVGSATPVFESIIQNPALKIVTRKWNANFIYFYGVQSDFYKLEDNNFELTLKSGRKLKFIPTSFLHEPFGFLTYDEKSKILFTGDLFATFTKDKSYGSILQETKDLSEIVIYKAPSLEIINDVITKLKQIDISLIAPQHGFIIENKDIVPIFDLFIQTYKKFVEVIK